jgi:hypothetical protein
MTAELHEKTHAPTSLVAHHPSAAASHYLVFHLVAK